MVRCSGKNDSIKQFSIQSPSIHYSLQAASHTPLTSAAARSSAAAP